MNPSYPSPDAKIFLKSAYKDQCVNSWNTLPEFVSSPLYVREFFFGQWSCAGIFFLRICTCRTFFFQIPPLPSRILMVDPLVSVPVSVRYNDTRYLKDVCTYQTHEEIKLAHSY